MKELLTAVWAKLGEQVMGSDAPETTPSTEGTRGGNGFIEMIFQF